MTNRLLMEIRRSSPYAQPVTKWATRFKLGLSTSAPVLRFEPENIFIIDDICT